MSGSSCTEFAQGNGLTTRAMKWFWEQYLGVAQVSSATPPPAYAAPMLAQSFSGLPPAVMVVAECQLQLRRAADCSGGGGRHTG